MFLKDIYSVHNDCHNRYKQLNRILVIDFLFSNNIWKLSVEKWNEFAPILYTELLLITRSILAPPL